MISLRNTTMFRNPISPRTLLLAAASLCLVQASGRATCISDCANNLDAPLCTVCEHLANNFPANAIVSEGTDLKQRTLEMERRITEMERTGDDTDVSSDQPTDSKRQSLSGSTSNRSSNEPSTRGETLASSTSQRNKGHSTTKHMLPDGSTSKHAALFTKAEDAYGRAQSPTTGNRKIKKKYNPLRYFERLKLSERALNSTRCQQRFVVNTKKMKQNISKSLGI